MHHKKISTIIRIFVFGEICFLDLVLRGFVFSGKCPFGYHNSIRINVCRENGIRANVQSGKKLSGMAFRKTASVECPETHRKCSKEEHIIIMQDILSIDYVPSTLMSKKMRFPYSVGKVHFYPVMAHF